MKKNRKECNLCDGNFTEKFKTNMPVFMGVNVSKVEEKFSECTICQCENCGEIFIKELLDVNDVYMNNHNIHIVGNIWEGHYVELCKFIESDVHNKKILEISDPSAKIVRKLKNFDSWTIVEPNPDDEVNDIENVFIIKEFFDENFNNIRDVDVIIHSHFFEHLYNPNQFLKKCFDILTDDGIMIMSIPDMEFFLENGYSPFNILHFEHTYFINKFVVEYLANKNGFIIVDEKKYNNHSVFYKLKKSKNITNKELNLKIGEKFSETWASAINNIEAINNLIDGGNYKNIYIFGAHVTTQFYLYNGLNKSKIIGIIDNSKSKQGYTLYGTNYEVFNPEVLQTKNDCLVICSHTGIYQQEIKNSLLKINKNIKFI
jgi:SAM-dependent methyltransferase